MVKGYSRVAGHAEYRVLHTDRAKVLHLAAAEGLKPREITEITLVPETTARRWIANPSSRTHSGRPALLTPEEDAELVALVRDRALRNALSRRDLCFEVRSNGFNFVLFV